MLELEVFLIVAETKEVTGENSYKIAWRPLNVAITQAEAEAQASVFMRDRETWLKPNQTAEKIEVISRFVPF